MSMIERDAAASTDSVPRSSGVPWVIAVVGCVVAGGLAVSLTAPGVVQLPAAVGGLLLALGLASTLAPPRHLPWRGRPAPGASVAVRDRRGAAVRASAVDPGSHRDYLDCPAGDQVTENTWLLVEISPSAWGELSLLSRREQLNKTTVINRAVQVYASLRELEERGECLLVEGTEPGRRPGVGFH